MSDTPRLSRKQLREMGKLTVRDADAPLTETAQLRLRRPSRRELREAAHANELAEERIRNSAVLPQVHEEAGSAQREEKPAGDALPDMGGNAAASDEFADTSVRNFGSIFGDFGTDKRPATPEENSAQSNEFEAILAGEQAASAEQIAAAREAAAPVPTLERRSVFDRFDDDDDETAPVARDFEPPAAAALENAAADMPLEAAEPSVDEPVFKTADVTAAAPEEVAAEAAEPAEPEEPAPAQFEPAPAAATGAEAEPKAPVSELAELVSEPEQPAGEPEQSPQAAAEPEAIEPAAAVAADTPLAEEPADALAAAAGAGSAAAPAEPATAVQPAVESASTVTEKGAASAAAAADSDIAASRKKDRRQAKAAKAAAKAKAKAEDEAGLVTVDAGSGKGSSSVFGVLVLLILIVIGALIGYLIGVFISTTWLSAPAAIELVKNTTLLL